MTRLFYLCAALAVTLTLGACATTCYEEGDLSAAPATVLHG